MHLAKIDIKYRLPSESPQVLVESNSAVDIAVGAAVVASPPIAVAVGVALGEVVRNRIWLGGSASVDVRRCDGREGD